MNDLVSWTVGGGFACVAVSIAGAFYRKEQVTFEHLVEGFLGGAGLLTGAHLMHCCFVPNEIGYIVDAAGVKANQPGLSVMMDQLPRLDLGIGSFACLWASAHASWKSITGKAWNAAGHAH